MSHSVPHKNT